MALAPLPSAHAADTPTAVTVSMKDFTFIPSTIHVQAGGTVTWTYDEVATDPGGCEAPQFQPPSPAVCGGHSTTAFATGPDGKPLWDSGVHRADGFPFRRTFPTVGSFSYYCQLHGGPHPNQPVTNMTGAIVVDPATGAASSSRGPSAVDSGGTLPPTGGAPLAGWALASAAAALALLAPRRRLTA